MQLIKAFSEVFTTVAIQLIAIAALPGCDQSRKKSDQQSQAYNNLYTARLAIVHYDEVYRKMPPAAIVNKSGDHLLSWRLIVLGGSPDGFPGKIDQSMKWDSPVNKPVTSRPQRLYCFRDQTKDRRLETNVVAIVGPGSAFDRKVAPRFADIPKDTVMLVEVVRSGVPWAAPGDIGMAEMEKRLPKMIAGKGFHVAFADGSIWHMRKDTPIRVLKGFCTVAGAKGRDRKESLSVYRIKD